MNIEFSSTNPKELFESFASQFGATIEDNTFILPKHIGQGKGNQVQLEEGLFITLFDFILHNSVQATRKSVDNGGYYPIICWLSNEEVQQEVEDEKNFIHKNSPKGIFFPSPKIESKYTIPANIRSLVFTVTITPAWLEKNSPTNSSSHIITLINSNNSFFLFEEISIKMELDLQKLLDINIQDSQSFIFHKSFAFSFLARFISSIEKRSNKSINSNINFTDVQKLFVAKQTLAAHFSNPPSIKELATNAAMSESKLQKLFKAIFGITTYQFVLKIRIEEAKKMLETKQFSVSEVGYRAGYTNLSHFTAAFKKQVGVNPKQFLKSK